MLLAGMPGEQHMLPMVVLSAALAGRGVPCRPLGANLPVDALVAAIRRTAPSVVVLWAQVAESADVEALRSLPRTRPRFRTFAAGPGWADSRCRRRIERLDSLVDRPSRHHRHGGGLTATGRSGDHSVAGPRPLGDRPFGRRDANDSNGVVGEMIAERLDDWRGAPTTRRNGCGELSVGALWLRSVAV